MKNILRLFTLMALLITTLNPTVTHAKAACPAQEFKPFLKAFERDLQIQKAFTAKPLRWSSYYPDYADKPKVSFLNSQEIDFPVLISRMEQSKQGVVLTMKKRNRFWYQVFTRSNGTGAYSLDLDFKKRNGCWYLTDVADLST